jgi:hypothetical protein
MYNQNYDKMILTKYHLGAKVEKPKKEDYLISEPVLDSFIPGQNRRQSFDQKAYQQALDFCEFVNNEVELEWISFEEREPEEGQSIVLGFEYMGCKISTVRFMSTQRPEYWYDKESHDARVKEWNKYQERYPGYEIIEDELAITFKKGDIEVTFTEGTVQILIGDKWCSTSESITCQLFEQLFEMITNGK